MHKPTKKQGQLIRKIAKSLPEQIEAYPKKFTVFGSQLLSNTVKVKELVENKETNTYELVEKTLEFKDSERAGIKHRMKYDLTTWSTRKRNHEKHMLLLFAEKGETSINEYWKQYIDLEEVNK